MSDGPLDTAAGIGNPSDPMGLSSRNGRVPRHGCFRDAGELARRVLERQRRLEHERREAPELLAQLERLDPSQRASRCQGDEKFQTWGLCEHILARSWACRFDDVARCEALARLGVTVTAHLSTRPYGVELKCDIRARAWAYLGNVLRIRGEYEDARAKFDVAQFLLRRGSGDPLEEARCWHMKAILDLYTRRFVEAERLLDRVASAYAALDDDRRVGLALADKAMVRMDCGDYPAAVPVLEEALLQLSPQDQSREYLAARHNLALALVRSGHPEEALGIVTALRPCFQARDERLNLARLDWLDGLVQAGLGDADAAIGRLKAARDELVSQGIGFDAADVSLDLASVYLEEARMAELEELAEEMLPVLALSDLHDHAVAALGLFQKACQWQELSEELVSRLQEYLQHARRDTRLAFRPR